ncbi:MAG: 50S ribosomal protein L24 [bacterium]|nr:50S ribosomal protein L24 [bacterium]
MLKKNDTVKIIVGKDRGKTGKVLRVDVKNGMVLVEGLNTVKKHVRPKKQGEKGQTISLPQPLYFSKVMLFCSSCAKGVRTRVRMTENKTSSVTLKERVCIKCQNVI